MSGNEKLSRREREILDVLFALGDQASADEIRDRLSDPPSYSAVRAMLAKLEAKCVIRHRAGYWPVVNAVRVARDMVEGGVVDGLRSAVLG